MVMRLKMASTGTASKFERLIYKQVKKIPKGRVATYGQIATLIGNPKAVRAVGNALNKNPNPKNIPCHRVVDRYGNLAKNFAFGGLKAQQRLLEKEGVRIQNGRVNLAKYRLN